MSVNNAQVSGFCTSCQRVYCQRVDCQVVQGWCAPPFSGLAFILYVRGYVALLAVALRLGLWSHVGFEHSAMSAGTLVSHVLLYGAQALSAKAPLSSSACIAEWAGHDISGSQCCAVVR